MTQQVPRRTLSGNFEQRGNEFRLGLDITTTDVANLPLADHCHRLVACRRSSSRPEAAKAKPWTGQAFHVPMVLLDDVVQVFPASCGNRHHGNVRRIYPDSAGTRKSLLRIGSAAMLLVA
jgi:hypothetical protein